MIFRKAFLLFISALALLRPHALAALTDRHSHTTTLLPDGNILITGGTLSNGTRTGEVQIYNMSANTFDTWPGGGPLDTPRSSHTATLMSNGKVLIAGGFDGTGTPLASLEICDPTTMICGVVAGQTLSPAKAGHTAVLLSSGPNAGRVLICGGQMALSSMSVTANCDIFNPANATVSPGSPMGSARVGHTMTLLPNGNVFVAGGRRWDQSNTVVYLPTVDIYDAVTGAWTSKDALNQGRVDHTATVLNNGLIMIAGGYNGLNRIETRSGFDQDVWTQDDTDAWGYTTAQNQNLGSHGYLDGAELFDGNGGRQVIAEYVDGVAPYRSHKHSALLLPDGSWSMFGGYGNIVRTMLSAQTQLGTNTVFYLTKTGNATATIDSSSTVQVPLTVELSKPVSGRLVDADAYFAAPSVLVENATLSLGHSTAPLDGSVVGSLGGNAPGTFSNVIQFSSPTGSVSFEPGESMTSDSSLYPTLTVTSSNLTFASPLAVGSDPKPYSGSVTGKLGMVLPSIYRGIRGLAIIRSGSIISPTQSYTLSILTGGNSNVVSANPDSCVGNECLFTADVTFSPSGLITNTGAAAINSPLDAAGAKMTLSFDLYYTADEIRTGSTAPQLAYVRADLVIREMIFSNVLAYTPKTGAWRDLNNTVLSPSMGEPVFDHTTILTPAADTLVLGGRNCEATPSSDCLRAAKNFQARDAYTAFIPVHMDANGSTGWAASGMLTYKRAYHTSTQLPDGGILTCGGSNGSTQLSSCELMDPQTKTWSAVGNMNRPRSKHTATLLPNGRVLVAGGAAQGGTTSTAEIYDPAARRWALINSMSEGRQNHTATLLPDGNVLIAGGTTLSTYSATAELYITSASIWMPAAGAMTSARAQHTATLLKNGYVLMTGGVNGFGSLNGTDIYNASNRTFAAGTALNKARYGHSASLMRDGSVVVIGGSDNTGSLLTAEKYAGGAWSYLPSMQFNRANHRSVLLPNGKLMVTGGEFQGGVQIQTEGYDPDFSDWSAQGAMAARSHHTSVLTSDNYIINIGGWNGSGYLDTTDIAYFSYYPDVSGFDTAARRQPEISTATSYFGRGDRVTLLSDSKNFHGVSGASGGGAGPANSSQDAPRVYLQQIDNPSGFMMDVSTRIYSLYSGPNTDWERTLSSITVLAPSTAGEFPYGYYHVRVAANGQFSEGKAVQATVPRPTGTPRFSDGLQYTFLGSTSVQWIWDRNGVVADGFAVFSATDSLLQGYAAMATSGTFTQSGLAPNTEVAISVAGYNIGGYGPSAVSQTYYTLATTPTNLTVDYASFETAALQWSGNGNSPATAYELSVSNTDSFASEWIAIPFSENHTSTSAVLIGLQPNMMYYFRVRARNGTELSRIVQGGVDTDYSNHASTKTVGNVSNVTGTAISASSIRWDWDPAPGNPSYEIYDITSGLPDPPLLSSSSMNGYTQSGMLPNSLHGVRINAFDPVTGSKGPQVTASAYTMAAQPLPYTPYSLTQITTGSMMLNWQPNGNPPETRFHLLVSPDSGFSTAISTHAYGHSSVVSGLAPNTLYYARASALNLADVETDASSLSSAYTLAQPPSQLRPTEVSMSGVTLTWNTKENPASTVYEVRGTTSPSRLTNSSVPGFITTYQPFSAGKTANVAAFNGLLTSTTYYFDVAAMNASGLITARTESVPSVFTTPGPSGAPTGSIGGTSNPSSDVTISGIMTDNRTISLSIPAAAYNSQTAIAIAPSTTDSCRQNRALVPLVEVAIYTQDNLQPQVPVTLTINYLSDDAATITPSISNLVMARYNPVTGECLPLETAVDPGARTITAKLNHFSVFQLVYKSAATNLNSVRVYPNPYYANRGQGFVTIDNMPPKTDVRIYTLSGDKIWEGAAGDSGLMTWNATNSSGVTVGSGVYLAVLDSTGGKKVVKIAVER